MGYQIFYITLAVSTHPPTGINYRTSRSNSYLFVRNFISIPQTEASRANSVINFISTHQVAPATAPLLLRSSSSGAVWLFARWRRHEFYYTARIHKRHWPWPWLKHSLGQHESLCQVWSWSAQPFGWPSPAYRQTDEQTDRHNAFYMLDKCKKKLNSLKLSVRTTWWTRTTKTAKIF